MGYRGEDRSRERAAWGAQSPRQPSRERADFGSTGYDDAGYDTANYDNGGYDGYAQGDDYQSGGYATGGYSTDRHGTGSHRIEGYDSDGYGSNGYGGASHDSGSYNTAGYNSDGYDSAGYNSAGYNSAGYNSAGYNNAGYDSADYNNADYNNADYNSGHSSGGTGGYPAAGYGDYDSRGGASGSGPYPALTSGSGPYPTLRRSSGEYPVLEPDPFDDGNDWYDRSGPLPAGGFADTSAMLAVRDVRDPVRGYPPEAVRPDPGLTVTRGQQRYDESDFVTYPGYDGVEDSPRGYGASRGYDAYDDYADQTRLDQVAIDYDAPNGGRDYASARPGDNFDGGMYRDDYADPSPLNEPGAPGRGGKKQKKKQQQKAAAVSPPKRDRTDKPAGKPKRGRRAFMLTTAVIIVIGAVGYAGYVGYHVVTKSKASNPDAGVSQPLPSVLPSAANQQCAAQFGGPFCHIQMRTDDPAPLTTSELYPNTVFNESSKMGFLLAATNVSTDCTKAVFGDDLMKQLKTGQCNQALRASYISDDKTMMGTIGVFNLYSTNEAHYAAKLIGSQNFMLPLKSSTGLTAKLGSGTGVIETEYKGHYLLVTWSQFTSGKAPTAAQTQDLEGFDSALLASTANSYLTQVMVNGDSATAAPSASGSATSSASASTKASASPSAS